MSGSTSVKGFRSASQPLNSPNNGHRRQRVGNAPDPRLPGGKITRYRRAKATVGKSLGRMKDRPPAVEEEGPLAAVARSMLNQLLDVREIAKLNGAVQIAVDCIVMLPGTSIVRGELVAAVTHPQQLTRLSVEQLLALKRRLADLALGDESLGNVDAEISGRVEAPFRSCIGEASIADGGQLVGIVRDAARLFQETMNSPYTEENALKRNYARKMRTELAGVLQRKRGLAKTIAKMDLLKLIDARMDLGFDTHAERDELNTRNALVNQREGARAYRLLAEALDHAGATDFAQNNGSRAKANAKFLGALRIVDLMTMRGPEDASDVLAQYGIARQIMLKAAASMPDGRRRMQSLLEMRRARGNEKEFCMIELWQCAADARAATEPAEFVRLLEKAARLAARLPEFEERLKPSKSLVALLNGLQKAARGRAGEIRGAGLDERMSEVLERIRNVRASATPAPAVG